MQRQGNWLEEKADKRKEAWNFKYYLDIGFLYSTENTPCLCNNSILNKWHIYILHVNKDNTVIGNGIVEMN